MKRVPLILFWILTAALVCSAQGTFYYPHVANGVLGGATWKTTIFLTNPASSGTASGTITLFHDNSADLTKAGTAFNISFTDENGAVSSGNTITFGIGSGQTKKFVSAGTGSYGGGFATVVTTAGTVSGTAVFSDFDSASGRLIAEAGVPAVPAVVKQAIFVDTVGGFNIGVAYANPGTSGASVTLSLFNAAAVSVATTTQTLGPGNHAAAFTSQIFSPPPAQLTGTMQISSTTPLAAIALRFDPTFSVFTTLPPVTLSSLIAPAMEWLERRAWRTPLTSVARLLGAFQLRFG